jgi:thioredoxin 1
MAFQMDLRDEVAFQKEVIETPDTLQGVAHPPRCAGLHCWRTGGAVKTSAVAARTDVPMLPAVLEVHDAWCGPCKAIKETCKRLFFENGDKGLKFYTVRSGTLQVTKKYAGKCEPVFMFFRDGKELTDARIQGVNAPLLVSTIMQSMPQTTAGG